NVQPEADVDAQRATVNSAEADSSAAESTVKAADENIRTMQAMLEKDKSDLDHAKADFDRSQSLFNEHLLAKQDFDLKKFTYEAQQATVRQSEMRLVQSRRPAGPDRGAVDVRPEAHRPIPRRPGARHRHPPETQFLRPAGWRGHQPARARRRNRSAGHSELRLEPHDDHRGHVADHRGSQGG